MPRKPRQLYIRGRATLLLSPPRSAEVMWCPAFICLFVSRMTQKVTDGFDWNIQARLVLPHLRGGKISVVTRISIWIQNWILCLPLPHMANWHNVGGGLHSPSVLRCVLQLPGCCSSCERKSVSALIEIRLSVDGRRLAGGSAVIAIIAPVRYCRILGRSLKAFFCAFVTLMPQDTC